MTSRPMAVSVIGAGTMGRGIANALATKGHRVFIVDRDPLIADRAKSSIERDLGVAIEEGFVAPYRPREHRGRITPTADLEEAVEKRVSSSRQYPRSSS